MSADSVQLGPVDYAAYVATLGRDLPDVAREVAEFTGVGQVLDWMQRKGLNLKIIDFVSQDEFEYDFLLEWEPGRRWLAFGVT